MTDNEIIKALECCSDGTGKGIIPATLDLINRLQEENERLKADCDKIAEDYSNLMIEKDELFDEAERLIKSAKAEAIKEFANDLYKKFAGHSDYHGDTILTKIVCMAEGQEVDVAKPLDTDNVKIKAIKEFAERLKEKQLYNYEWECNVVECETIDNLVKEMVGEG